MLSEDHFLVKTGRIDPVKDEVVACSRSDGQVEAVLLQGETISQVYRDPAAAGGWNIRAIAAGATDMVAGVADNVQGYPTLHVFYRTASGDVRHLIEDLPSKDGISSAKFTPADDVSWGPAVRGPLQVTTDLYRNLLVFSITAASSENAGDSKLGFHWTGWGLPGGQAQSGVLTGFGLYSPQESPSRGSAAISYSLSAFQGHPALLLYVPSASGVQVYQFMPDYATQHLTVSGQLDRFAEQPPNFVPPFSDRVVVESVDYLFSPGVNYLPTAIVRGVNQELYALTVDFLRQTWHLQQLQLSKDKRESGKWDWEPSNLNLGENNVLKTNALLNLFVVSAGALSVVRQVDLNSATKNSVTPVYNPAVPLQGGVAAVTSQARASAGDELIVVDSDGNLEVLTKSADGGWAATVIHLPASEPAEVSAYRVQLTVSDDWGVRVAGKPLQVSASGPAVALLNGQAVALSSSPVTLTTDRSGQVTIPIVADGLWAPKLTVSGGGLTAPVTVSPSDAVNNYMTGTVTLNYLPQMSGDTLAAAASPTGATVFPLAKQDKDIAAQAATLLAGVAAAGANPTVAGQSTEQHDAAASGHGPSYHEAAVTRDRQATLGTRPAQRDQTVTVDGIELSFGDLVDDALYAIKRGAAKVSQVVLTWDKSLNRWVSTITADFDAWAQQAVAVTIHDLEDAGHIFHGVVNHLGALLTDVIDWLKAHVLKLLADTVTLASRYDGWLLQLSDELYTLTQKAERGADGYLKDQGPRVKQALQEIKAQLGSRSISSFTQPPTFSTKLQASPDPTPHPPTTAGDNWLLEKVTVSGVAPSKTPPVDDALNALVKHAKTNIDSAGQDFIKAANDFRDALARLVSNPKNFGSVAIDDLIDAIEQVIDAGLAAAEGVVDVMLDLVAAAISAFRTLLATPINDLPVLGPLLKAAGMSTAPTIGGLVTLLVAFPTALGYKLAHFDADALPFKNARTSSVLRVADAADDGLSYATFAATSFWALMDTIAASVISGGEDPPTVFAWVDIVAPAVISALTVPAHDDGLPFSSAIKLDDTGDVYTAVAWGLAALPGVFAGIAYYIGERYNQADAEVASQSTLFFTSLTGFGAAVFGVIAAVDTSTDLADAALPAALAVLGNTAAALAWGLEKETVAGTDGLSAIFAGVIGGVCTFVGSVIDSFGV
ncbi:MAG TPA: hypothetical protein VHX62_18495 [Solirubrobacteraceae bacterium]|nr:hypothetical protein [Solirubrobacteraceae bacterium]